MQANLEAQRSDLRHGIRQAGLQGRFTTTENHCFEQALAPLEECQDLLPFQFLATAWGDQ
nr:hypothetical protein FFPRI1PSEUD_33100 [Pseudomonas sp. FFPRI_1]